MAEADPSDGGLSASARMGPAALRVASTAAVVPFYRDAIGLGVDEAGDRVRLMAGSEALIELVEDPEAPERDRTEAGLFHVAVRVPDRISLADVLGRVRGSAWGLSGASDHLVSEALYLSDPEGNGLEVYRDRPTEEWPRREDGRIHMDTLRLDLDGLASAASGTSAVPAGTRVGHVHLEVTDLGRSESFYREGLGLGLQSRYGADAAFLAAGDYHHHLGLNAWNGRTAPRSPGHRGLEWFTLTLPDRGALEAAAGRLEAAGADVSDVGGGIGTADPDGIELRLEVG